MFELGHSELRQSSEDWFNKEYKDKCVILDPDGWDRSPEGYNYSWKKELITHEEFTRRLCSSTVQWNTSRL